MSTSIRRSSTKRPGGLRLDLRITEVRMVGHRTENYRRVGNKSFALFFG